MISEQHLKYGIFLKLADRVVPLKSRTSPEGSVRSVSMGSDSLPIVLFHITDRTSREGSCRLCWPGAKLPEPLNCQVQAVQAPSEA
jgi:hypothetical protein